jgi:hypothetical protein
LWVLFADSEAWIEAISSLSADRKGRTAQIDDRARG